MAAERPPAADAYSYPEDAKLDRALAWGAAGLLLLVGLGAYGIYRMLKLLGASAWPIS